MDHPEGGDEGVLSRVPGPLWIAQVPKAHGADQVLELCDEASEGRSIAALGLPYPLAYPFRFHHDLQEHFTAPTVTSFRIGCRSRFRVCCMNVSSHLAEHYVALPDDFHRRALDARRRVFVPLPGSADPTNEALIIQLPQCCCARSGPAATRFGAPYCYASETAGRRAPREEQIP